MVGWHQNDAPQQCLPMNDKLKAQAQESPWEQPCKQCTFFSKSHYIFCPSAHNGSNGPHLKHGKRQFYLCLHHDHQLVLSLLPSFQDLVYGNQKWSATFWECIVDHYSKHKLVGGRENFDSKLVEPNNKGNDHECLHHLQGARAIKEDQESTKLKKCVL